jgi:proteasome lid subunit RPN8/RPN11
MALILTQEHLNQIVEHARAGAPSEVCGLLVGLAGRVFHVLPAANIAPDPSVEYLMDPHDQLRHFQVIEEQGLELLGIYHSHPGNPAYPSPTDMSRAYYPEAIYGIVSLMRSETPVLRTFRLVDGQVSEVAFEVIPAQGLDSRQTPGIKLA